MAKISHGANTWRSEGLAKKYKELAKLDEPTKHKAKKNTRKWCKGKVGVEHELQRYFWRYGWEQKRTNWIRCKCTVCGKEFHNKSSSIPLRIDVESNEKAHPVQVKVNGAPIPIDYRLFHDSGYWCSICDEWHF